MRAAHAVAALWQGWSLAYVDVVAGVTEVIGPDYQEQSISDRWLQEALIAAAPRGSAAPTGSGLSRTSFQVFRRGLVDWKTARKRAEELTADHQVKRMYDRVVAALRMVGRLEGDALQRVLEGD